MFFLLHLIKRENEIKSTKKITFFYLFDKPFKKQYFFMSFFVKFLLSMSFFLDKVLAKNWLIFYFFTKKAFYFNDEFNHPAIRIQTNRLFSKKIF